MNIIAIIVLGGVLFLDAGRALGGMLIAHRGAEVQAPENTLASQRIAYEEGADAVECDLRATSDSALVILHDATLDRTTTGSGNVWTKTLSEVRALDAGAWFGSDFAGERVPLLKEMMAVAANYSRKLLVDVKGEGWAGLVRKVADEAGVGDDTLMFLTWSPQMTRDYRAKFPGSLIMILTEMKAPDVSAQMYAQFRSWGADHVFFNSTWYISEAEIARCHANGLGASMMRTTPSLAHYFMAHGLDSFLSQDIRQTVARYRALSSTWQLWGKRNGLPAAILGENMDPDGDGYTNLMEFALGGDPNEADSAALSSKLTGFHIDTATGAFEWNVDLGEGWSDYAVVEVQTSADLKTWTTASASCCTVISPTRLRFRIPRIGVRTGFCRLVFDVVR